MRYWAVLALVLVACDDDRCVPRSFYDPRPIWIDNGCPSVARRAIEDAIEVMNDFSEDNICQPLVEVQGYVHADYYLLDPDVGGRNIVVCYDNEPRWYYNVYDGNLITGSASSDVIRLFLFRRDPPSYEFIRHLMLHELMHWVAAIPGVKGIGHLAETNDGVMLSGGPEYQEYTEDDRDLFCESFDCV